MGAVTSKCKTMISLNVSLADRSYPIYIGQELFETAFDPLAQLAQGRQIAIVSNAAVFSLYGAAIKRALGFGLPAEAKNLIEILLPDGEAYKTFDSLNLIFDALLAARFDRHCLIIALGGGVIGDIAGFAAATYQRGVDFVQVPTTLLAQVDSSVGGKTAINHPLGKNMIGAFHQPKMVIANVSTLQTLPQREISAGLAEMLKHGAIARPAYFDDLVSDLGLLIKCDPSKMMEAVRVSCVIKADVVSQDEREGGLRAILNFGHTFGHAIESGLGYGEWLHGEAVGAGMVMAADLSARLGLIAWESVEKIREANVAAGLPIAGPAWSAERYIELMAGDKKSEQGIPKFVLLSPFGTAVVRKVPEPELRATLEACVVSK
jgi:shikimate kinase / 3-dehydroquinate synthase